MRLRLRVIVFCVASLAACKYAGAQGYREIKRLPIQGNGGWDYIALSPVNDNIYVSHASMVNIVNRVTGESVGVIPNTDGVHGIALAPGFGKGFTSNGKSNSITVFDISTNLVRDRIQVGENPDAIMYDPFSKMVFVCNGKSRDVTIIDPSADQVVKTVGLGGKPETAVSDGRGKIYINLEDKNEIAVLDTRTFSVGSHWKTGRGQDPSGLAIDVETRRLFAGCGNKLLVVVNADDGNVITELPIGDGCDGTAFDPGNKTVFSANGDGTLTVIKEKKANVFEVVEQARTEPGARTLALDEKTHKVYLPVAEFSPEAVPQQSRKHRPIVPGTFHVLVIGR